MPAKLKAKLRGGVLGPLTSLSLAVGMAVLLPSHSIAHDESSGADKISRTLLAREALPGPPGHIMTVVSVEIPPGTAASPHRHGGLVYVYMLEGSLRSQLNDEPPQDYAAGESWVEPAGALHTMTRNLSATEPARFLAVIISPEGAAITAPAKTDGGDGK